MPIIRSIDAIQALFEKELDADQLDQLNTIQEALYDDAYEDGFDNGREERYDDAFGYDLEFTEEGEDDEDRS